MKTYSGKAALQSSRAQIKMFETIGVLVIFFMLLGAGGAFYFKLQESSLQKDLEKVRQLRVLQSSLKATFLPELDCSFVSVQRENCFDRLKLMAFANLTQDPQKMPQYFGLFGTSTVTVKEIYPDPGFFVILYHNPLDEYSSAKPSRSPVIIYNPITDSKGFGIIEVMTYSQ